jgi:lincosamide nucleotidyltransferase A/C/D/E
MEPADREMTAADVLAFLDLVAAERVRIWVDGGWAVDACLGAQTRPHEDLDIVIEERDLSTAVPYCTGADTDRCRAAIPVPGTSCSVTTAVARSTST